MLKGRPQNLQSLGSFTKWTLFNTVITYPDSLRPVFKRPDWSVSAGCSK